MFIALVNECIVRLFAIEDANIYGCCIRNFVIQLIDSITQNIHV